MPSVDYFLEIGTGAGNVLVEALLQKKCKRGFGSDISVPAIENAKLNLQKFNVEAGLAVSDVLDGIGKDNKFDLIYWNYPYHFNFHKTYEKMTLLEIGLRDPDYLHLEKLLATAR